MTPPSRFHSPPCIAAILAFSALSIISARADATYAPPPQQEEGIGGFFHRLFGGQTDQAPPQKSQGYLTSDSTRYNLDRPPPTPSPKHHAKTDAVPDGHEPKTTETNKKIVATTDTTKHAPESHWRSNRPAESEKPDVAVKKTKRSETAQETNTIADSDATQTNKSTFSRPDPTPPVKPEEEPKTTAPTNPTPPRSASDTAGTKPAASTTSKETLTATRGSKPGRVKSPYAPFSELDVTGLSSGALAMDPTTNRVFRVP